MTPKPNKPPKPPEPDQAPVRPDIPRDEGTAANLGDQVEPNQRGGDSKSHLGG